jgi:hypothetical protein
LEARQRWTDQGRQLQALGSQRIAAIEPEKLPVDEARRFVLDGAQLEGRGLGLDSRPPLQITQQTATIQIDPDRARQIVERFLQRRERERKEPAIVEVQNS